MKNEPLKNKLLYKDEGDLYEFFCDEIAECSGEQRTESDPTGCTGCSAQDEWVDKHYSDLVLDECESKRFASEESIKSAVEWLKEKTNKHLKQWKENEGRLGTELTKIGIINMIELINNYIDGAFEDVTKK